MSTSTITGDKNRAWGLGIQAFMALLNVFITNPGLLDEAERIGLSYSPSKAFNQGYVIAKFHRLEERHAIPFAKLCRWIAVLKRDYGEPEARRFVDELRAYLNNIQKPRSMPQSSGPSSHGVGLVNVSNPKQGTKTHGSSMLSTNIQGIIPGIYRYGRYDWIAETRIEKMNKLFRKEYKRELPRQLYQLAIEVFHSLYLVRTDLSTDRINTFNELATIIEITEPIRNSRLIREKTVLDELTSILVATKILSKIMDELERVAREKGLNILDLSLSELTGNDIDYLREKMKEVLVGIEKEVEDLKNASKIIEQLMRKKGIGHKIEVEDIVDIMKILKGRKIMVKKVLEAIQSISKDRRMIASGTIEFKGYKKMESYHELSRTRLTEFSYPETIVLKKLAEKDLHVRRYDRGTRREEKKFIVLIDSSGSMKGERIEWAKAVALSLLLRPDVHNVKVAFFDSAPYPEPPLDFRENPIEALKYIAGQKATGGTNIENALRFAEKHAPDHDIVLITDGEDHVEYKPKNKLITILIATGNKDLEEISDKLFKINELKASIVKDI